jgi:hypothetical protein
MVKLALFAPKLGRGTQGFNKLYLNKLKATNKSFLKLSIFSDFTYLVAQQIFWAVPLLGPFNI